MKRSNGRMLGSLFSRMLLTFLVIILPLYMLSIELFRWSQGKVTEQLHQSVYYQMTYFINDFEHSIDRLRTLQYNYLLDADTHQLAYAEGALGSYERTKTINRIGDAMTILHNSSELIESVSVYLPGSDRVIRSKETMVRSPEYHSALLEQMSDTRNSTLPIACIDGSMHVYSFYPRFIFTDGQKMGILIDAVLSEKRLQEMLGDLNHYDGGYVCLVSEAQNYSVGNRPPEAAPEQGYMRFIVDSESTGFALVQYVPRAYISRELSHFRGWLCTFILLTVGVVVLYSVFSYRIIQLPINKLLAAFCSIKSGDLGISIHHKAKDDFSFIYQQFNEMAERLRTVIDEVLAQRMLAQNAEMKQLQAQINPHFLYNSFFIMRRMIKKKNSEQALSFTELLGTYFKYMTRNGEQMTPLTEEVQHARAYARIQEMRFENRITVDFPLLPTSYHNYVVPKLIIQPLLENAFEHGLRDTLADGVLRIGFREGVAGLTVEVEDNGGGIDDAWIRMLDQRAASGSGLEEYTGVFNISRRLELEYGADSRLYFSRSQLGGLKVSFLLPKEHGHA